MKYLLFLVCLMLASIVSGQDGLNKSRVDVISIPKRVEFSPTISADGRTMIFEAQNGKKWELYQSLLKGTQWSEPVPLTAINEKFAFIAGPCLNYEANTLYYTGYMDGVSNSEDIFYSVRLDDQRWSEPKSLGAPINTPDEYEGFPSISADGRSLYFIRQNKEYEFDKKTKEPCFKIFVAHKQPDGTWSEPAVLPEPVNTGCERDPRIMADNHTLIFSSIRTEGKGKYDLYQTRLLHNGTWDEPVPLDFVNSEESDQSPGISAAGNLMYYYSDDDIYEVTIPAAHRQMINITLLGTVTAGPDNKPIRSVITVRNLKDGASYFTQSNEHDGRYSIVMAAGQSYEVMFSSLGFRPGKLTFDYSKEETYREERQDVHLSSSWPLSLAIHDKDLKSPVRAKVTLTGGDNQVVVSDTVDISAMPAMFDLRTDQQYTLAVAGPSYLAYTQNLKFVPQTFKEGEPYVVNLEREKIPVVADVTVGINGPKKRVKVTYKNEDTGEVIVADAGDVVNLRKGDRYQVMTSSDKGFSYAMQSIVAGENSSGTIPLPILELKEGTLLALSHINFESNSSQLNKSSTTELEQIVSLLKQNPQVVIEISAHTDDVGSDAYNDNLSQQRAKSVTTFLAGKGIPLKQLVSVGYGKTRPIVPNDSEENRRRNRRVEMLVLKVG